MTNYDYAEDVFRCDYCGEVARRRDADIYWEFVAELDDGRLMWRPAVYCSNYCGRRHSQIGSGRG